jgi:hypothetical protein
MSDLKLRFHLFEKVHTLFNRSLPALHDEQSVRYGDLPEAGNLDLANDNTLLRADMVIVADKLGQIDIDHVANIDTHRLIQVFDSFLSLFEASVLDFPKVGTLSLQAFIHLRRWILGG